MKKILAALLAVIMISTLVLSGCNGGASSSTWTPTKASAEIEPYARRAIEIIDGYLSFDLSAKEATYEFDALYQRIKPYNIRGVDSTYSDPDQTIAFIIDSLAVYDARIKSDVEYHQYRDILAFQIGEPVSGRSYDAKRLGLDYCPKLIELFNADTLPIAFADEHEFDSLWYWSMSFDAMNGVSISNLQDYIDSVYKSLLSSDIENASIFFYYSCYEQDVFSISINIIDGKLTGSVRQTGEHTLKAYEQLTAKYTSEEIAAMDEYPKEFAVLNPLYEFDSIEQLPDAIAAARTFFGDK